MPARHVTRRGVLHARAFLESTLGKAASGAGHRSPQLPSLRAAARQAGVAYLTMWRAAQELAREGRLDVRHGSRISAPGTTAGRPNPTSAQHRTQPRWSSVRNRIRADLEKGHFGDQGQLPGLHKLAARYGTTYRVVRQAVSALVEAGLLEPHKRGHRVCVLASASPGGWVAAIAWQGAVPDLLGLSSRRSRIYAEIEHECGLHNLKVRLWSYCYDPGIVLDTRSSRVSLERAFADQTDLLGFVVLATGIVPDDRLQAFLRRLSAVGKPVCVLDESAQVPHRFASNDKTVLLLTAGSSDCGADMGRYLLAQGHRRISYISPHHAENWSRNRLEGLTSVYASAGFPPDSVRLFVFEDEALKAETEKDTETASFAERLRQSILEHRERLLGVDPLLRRCLMSLAGRSGEVASVEIERKILSPLLAAARLHADSTAWVAANDLVGVHAMGYLRRHGVGVPGVLSVVGFDNTLEARIEHLTSYDFNEHATASAVVKWILQPRARSDGKPVQIGGFVTVRESSGPPRAG